MNESTIYWTSRFIWVRYLICEWNENIKLVNELLKLHFMHNSLHTDEWIRHKNGHFLSFRPMSESFNASFIINKAHSSTYWRNDITSRQAYWTDQWMNLNKTSQWKEWIQKIQSVGWIKNTHCYRAPVSGCCPPNTRWRKKGRIFPSGKSDLSRTAVRSQPASQALNSCIKCVNTPTHTTNKWLAKCTQNWLHIAQYTKIPHTIACKYNTNALLTQNIKLNTKRRYFTHFIPPSTFPMVNV